MEQSLAMFTTWIEQYMYFVRKITAPLASNNILKRFAPNCGMWVVIKPLIIHRSPLPHLH